MDALHPLIAANQAAHAQFTATLEAALVAFTELDVGAAIDAWQRLGAQIAAHQVVEETLLARATVFDDVTAVRGGTPTLVVTEHRRLDQLLATAAATLGAVAASPVATRRVTMVRGLDDILRVLHFLEHHGGREDGFVYPRVVALETPALVAEATLAMTRASARFEVRSPAVREFNPA